VGGRTVRQLQEAVKPGQLGPQWVFDHRELAGFGTDTLPRAAGLYLPLTGSQRTVGVLGVRPQAPARLLDPEQMHLLETFASHTALAIERAQLANEAQQATVEVETERLRSALLSSVSHDLRTPLAIISGTLSSLAQAGNTFDAAARDELAQTAADEALRLNHLLSNLLEMTRLEAGAIHLRTEWQPLEEVVGVAVARVAGNESQSGMLPGDRPLSITLPPDLPLVPLDSILIEQVLVNLLGNAIQHTAGDAGSTTGAAGGGRRGGSGGRSRARATCRCRAACLREVLPGGADSGRGNVGLGPQRPHACSRIPARFLPVYLIPCYNKMRRQRVGASKMQQIRQHARAAGKCSSSPRHSCAEGRTGLDEHTPHHSGRSRGAA